MTTATLVFVLVGAAGVGLVAGVGLLARAAARNNATLKYNILRLTLAAAWAAPLVTLAGAQSGYRPTVVFGTVAPAAPAPLPPNPPLLDPKPLTAASAAPRPAGVPPAPRPAPQAAGSLAPALAGAYLLIAAGLACAGAARIAASRRIISAASPVTDAQTIALWRTLCAQSRSLAAAALLESDAGPSCWRLRRPTVILPRNARARFGDEGLEWVLRHELTHLRRRDTLAALAAHALTSIFWVQPLAWTLARALAADAETSADAEVVRRGAPSHGYALALLASWNGPAHQRGALAGFAHPSCTRRRIHMLTFAQSRIDRRRAGLALGLSTGALAAAVAVAAMLGMAASPLSPSSHPPPSDGDAMRAEIRAPVAGRSDTDVWRRLIALDAMREHAVGAGAWMTDQETVLSAEKAMMDGPVLKAEEFLMSLPEGSGLRAVVEGRRIVIRPEAAGLSMVVEDGGITVLDDDGTARVTVRSGEGVPLWLSSTEENGEYCFRLRPSEESGAARLRATIDPTTGVPEGEEQPPHGSIRWQMLSPQRHERGTHRLKMQWIYNLQQLQQDAEKSDERGGAP